MTAKFNLNFLISLKLHFINVFLILLWLNGYNCNKLTIDKYWEIAVLTPHRIEFFGSDGQEIGATAEQFDLLKAITYDNQRRKFIVSHVDQKNTDQISVVDLDQDLNVTHLVRGLPDDVQGLTIDPIENVLYWADSLQHSISYLNLNNTNSTPEVLFQDDTVTPKSVTLDVCNRFIYYVNSQYNTKTGYSIERIPLNGTDREILISSDIIEVTGIALDYRSQKLYFADNRHGNNYRIDCINLITNKREKVYQGTYVYPQGVAVDDDTIYWTDKTNSALWRKRKDDKENQPEKIKVFMTKPSGLISRTPQIRYSEQCDKLIQDTKVLRETIKESLIERTERPAIIPECLNDGELHGNTCHCQQGFTGAFCETETCRNYCFQGTCYITSYGYPKCHCFPDYGGDRCEQNKCFAYCLNGGSCQYLKGDVDPRCDCFYGYEGNRCERIANREALCKRYCNNEDDGYGVNDINNSCNCNDTGLEPTEANSTTSSLHSESSPFYGRSFFEKLSTDPDFVVLITLLIFCILFNTAFMIYHYTTRPKRPIIKKRVIVQRNETPMTYRASPTTEQCEITIENCCNMNVCETPCFEPPSFRTRNWEDKKVLLAAMEDNNEEEMSS